MRAWNYEAEKEIVNRFPGSSFTECIRSYDGPTISEEMSMQLASLSKYHVWKKCVIHICTFGRFIMVHLFQDAFSLPIPTTNASRLSALRVISGWNSGSAVEAPASFRDPQGSASYPTETTPLQTTTTSGSPLWTPRESSSAKSGQANSLVRYEKCLQTKEDKKMKRLQSWLVRRIWKDPS